MNADTLLNSEPAAFATDKLIDRLFTKTSLRCITASSIRERERLIHLFKGIDRAIHSTGVEYEYYKKVLNRRHNTLEKKKNRPPVDVSHKPAAASVPAHRTHYSHVARPPLPNTAPAFNLTDPLSPPTAKTQNVLTRIALQKPRGLSTASEADSVFLDDDTHVPLDPHKPVPSHSKTVSIRQPMSRDELKELVLKLRRSGEDAPDFRHLTEQERKVYEFLQTQEPSVNKGRRGSTRLWTGDTLNSLKRPSIALADEAIDEQQSESGSSERYMRRVRSQPSILPPIYRQNPRPLAVRQLELDDRPSKKDRDYWEDLKYCRYLRAPAGMLKELDTETEGHLE